MKNQTLWRINNYDDTKKRNKDKKDLSLYTGKN